MKRGSAIATTTGSKKAAEQGRLNTVISQTKPKRTNFQMVAVGICPHDKAQLGDEITGQGVGVTLICEKCGHRWYLNKKIKTCKCLTCSTEKRSSTKRRDNKLDTSTTAAYNNGVYAGVAELADAADLKSLPSLPCSLLIERFIESRRDGLSPFSIKNYRLYLRLASEVVGFNVTGHQIQRFIASRHCSGGGKHAYYRCLRAFYNWLYSPKSGLRLNFQDNPMLIVEAPKVEKKILPSLTPAQLDYLIDQVTSVRDKAIISLFADSGLRLVELAYIDPRNIDWQNRLIKVKCKGNKEGYAPFGARTE